MGERGRKLIETGYSIQAITDQYEALLEGIVAGRPLPAANRRESLGGRSLVALLVSQLRCAQKPSTEELQLLEDAEGLVAGVGEASVSRSSAGRAHRSRSPEW